MSDVNTELGRSATANISLNETAVRTLAGVASGTISMNNLRGKSNAPTFSPAGGNSAGTAVNLFGSGIGDESISITIDCSVSAVWNYTRTGAIAGQPPTGSVTATSITFSLSNPTTSYRQTLWSVNATAGGITKYWNVQIDHEGFA